jgi:hemerythrin
MGSKGCDCWHKAEARCAMGFIAVTDDMIQGIREIDAQHLGLINLINELYEIALAGEKSRTLDYVLDELDAYANMHFETEERLLEQTGYPRLAEHKAAHRSLRQKAVEFRGKMRTGREVIVALELLHLLKQWMAIHLKVEDKDACVYLKAHGIR